MKIPHWNYPLIFGGLLSGLFVVLAFFGPSLAPHDPMESTGLMYVDGEPYAPPPLGKPLPPFLTSEYPLGVDRVGRDVWSRLLWSIRPTLILCSVIVAVRVTLGVALGLAAGWFGGWAARLIDALISISVSVPLLVFAVAALLVLGLERGLLAFVVALSLTAWCDTAALVRTQTLAVRGAPYIESARAIGQRSASLLWRHVLPQLRPILPVMIAFEFSAVLLVVAELGYLGYYIGGGFVYVYSTGNTDTQRLMVSGAPELGQLLSNFFPQLYSTPWISIFAGTTVFLALVGFVLLGEGLRRALDVSRPRRLLRRSWRRGAERASTPTPGRLAASAHSDGDGR